MMDAWVKTRPMDLRFGGDGGSTRSVMVVDFLKKSISTIFFQILQKNLNQKSSQCTRLYRIRGGCGAGRLYSPSPIIFKGRNLPQQIIYH